MLLLKKKKYAAVKVQFKDGTPYEVNFCKNKYFFAMSVTVVLNKISIITFLLQVIERKGLDMVRRDWSLLSKELGDFCLAQILSGGYAILSFFFTVILTLYLAGIQRK